MRQPPPELTAVLDQLQASQPRLVQDTVAMAEALERLTVTRWEAWAGVLTELAVDANRKLLSLQVRVGGVTRATRRACLLQGCGCREAGAVKPLLLPAHHSCFVPSSCTHRRMSRVRTSSSCHWSAAWPC